MSDKVWLLSNFCSDFLHLNKGNGAMPLNLLPKGPSYVVFIMLYEFCIVWNFLSWTFSLRVIWCVVWYVVFHCLPLNFSLFAFLCELMFRFAGCISVLYEICVAWTFYIISCCACYIIVLYKRVVCVLYFLIFSKKKICSS